MTARNELYAFGMLSKEHSPANSNRMSQKIDDYRAEIRTEMFPDDQETLEEAATAYRHLRPMIEATMADSSRWDGDEDEATILGYYVRWLAAERAKVRAEVLREAGDVAGELIARLDRTGDPDSFTKADAYRAYSDELHVIADGQDEPEVASGKVAATAREALYAYMVHESDDDNAEFTRRVEAVVAEALAGAGLTAIPASEITPIAAHWNRLVIHPETDPTEDTIVCCLTDDGYPVALFLDDEHREALGMSLLDPDGDGDEPSRETDFFQPGHGYTHRDGTDFHCVAVATHPNTGGRLAIGWHTDVAGWAFLAHRDINAWRYEYDGFDPPTRDTPCAVCGVAMDAHYVSEWRHLYVAPSARDTDAETDGAQ